MASVFELHAEQRLFFSVEELMAMCHSAQVNIMLFREMDGRRLVLEDCCLKFVGAPIMVKIKSNSCLRVRSHYERLISLAELKQFEAALSAGVKELEESADHVNDGVSKTNCFDQSADIPAPPTPCGTFPDRKRRRLSQKTSVPQVLRPKTRVRPISLSII